MTKPFRIVSPIYLKLGKTAKAKNYSLNLNQYRNNHYRVNANLKKKYHELMIPLLEGVTFPGKIGLEFKLYKGSNRISDKSNFLCIVEKFFSDAMVEAGCIPDDNDDIITYSLYTAGVVDKENPRCEITIHDLSGVPTSL